MGKGGRGVPAGAASVTAKKKVRCLQGRFLLPLLLSLGWLAVTKNKTACKVSVKMVLFLVSAWHRRGGIRLVGWQKERWAFNIRQIISTLYKAERVV